MLLDRKGGKRAVARASALLYLRARARSWPSIADEPEQGRAMVVGGWAGRVYTQPPPPALPRVTACRLQRASLSLTGDGERPGAASVEVLSHEEHKKKQRPQALGGC